MPDAVTEELLRMDLPLVIDLHVMFPGKAYATVQLCRSVGAELGGI